MSTPEVSTASGVSRADAALVLFSGGQDSSVCLAWALERYARVETVGFDYGQRHVIEMQARQSVRHQMVERFPHWADRLGEDHVLDLTGFGAVAQSALTADVVPAATLLRWVVRVAPNTMRRKAGAIGL